jgi:hypothetical protein
MSRNAFYLRFEVENHGAQPQTVDIGVGNDIKIGENENAPVWALPDGRGFIVYDGSYVFGWALRGFPLVTNVTTYWYGYWRGLFEGGLWNQTDQLNLSGIDSAFAFSWQNVSVPAGGIAVRGVFVKCGNLESQPISLSLDFEFEPESDVYYLEQVNASGWVRTNSTGPVAILLIIDDDIEFYVVIGTEFRAANEVNFSFSATELDVSPGRHDFAFYAIDDDGNIAEPVVFGPTIVGPTATQSRTPTASPSLSTAATQTPAPLYPMDIVIPQYGPAFQIEEITQDGSITFAHGYGVFLEVGNASGWLEPDVPLEANGVVLSFHAARLSANAFVLAFKLRNTGADTRTARFRVLADLLLDGDEKPPVTEIEPQRGFTVSSWRYALSFVLRDYKFVDDVSTFYYGSGRDLSGHEWDQVSPGSSGE